MERLRPQQVWEELQRFPCVFVPSGPLEWHGRQNPIGLDALKAHALCQRAASRNGGLVFPPQYLQATTVPWPLGMPVAPDLVQANAQTVLDYLARNGAAVVIWLSGHGGAEDYLALRRAALNLMERSACLVYTAVDGQMISDWQQSMDHAGAIETSILQHLHPETVDLGALDPDPAVAPEGVGGDDPRSHTSAERGTRYTHELVTRLVAVALRLVALRDPVARRQHRACVAQQVALDDIVVYGRAYLAQQDQVAKDPPGWAEHLEAFRTGDYAAALRSGATVIENARLATAGRRPAGSSGPRVV